jgi:hypothetical protein
MLADIELPHDEPIQERRTCFDVGITDQRVGRRGTNQLRLLERYLDVLVKHTT